MSTTTSVNDQLWLTSVNIDLHNKDTKPNSTFLCNYTSYNNQFIFTLITDTQYCYIHTTTLTQIYNDYKQQHINETTEQYTDTQFIKQIIQCIRQSNVTVYIKQQKQHKHDIAIVEWLNNLYTMTLTQSKQLYNEIYFNILNKIYNMSNILQTQHIEQINKQQNINNKLNDMINQLTNYVGNKQSIETKIYNMTYKLINTKKDKLKQLKAETRVLKQQINTLQGNNINYNITDSDNDIDIDTIQQQQEQDDNISTVVADNSSSDTDIYSDNATQQDINIDSPDEHQDRHMDIIQHDNDNDDNNDTTIIQQTHDNIMTQHSSSSITSPKNKPKRQLSHNEPSPLTKHKPIHNQHIYIDNDSDNDNVNITDTQSRLSQTKPKKRLHHNTSDTPTQDINNISHTTSMPGYETSTKFTGNQCISVKPEPYNTTTTSTLKKKPKRNQ